MGSTEDAPAHDGHGETRERLALAATFALAALRYWLSVFPRVAMELRRLHSRAERIADPTLRHLALEALSKRSNIEGAAAFAAFVPRRQRTNVTSCLVAFQAIYNHVDTLAEQPSAEPARNAERLHQALLVALDPAAYLERHCRHDDGGYLEEIVETCRGALLLLPSNAVVTTAAQLAAARIVAFQTLSVAAMEDGPHALKDWTSSHAPAGSELEWWEIAAAAGSSLAVNALIAAAAQTSLTDAQVAAIEHAYFPWLCALHSLLDSLVDRDEDAETAQLSLIGCYPSAEQAAARLSAIAERSTGLLRGLPGWRSHQALLAAMAGSYAQALRGTRGEQEYPQAGPGVMQAMDVLARPTMLVFATRARVAALTRMAARSWPGGRGMRSQRSAEPPQPTCWHESEGKVDARAT